MECGCTNDSLEVVLEDIGLVAAYGFENCTLLAFAFLNDSSPSSSFNELNIEHNCCMSGLVFASMSSNEKGLLSS